MGFGQSAMLKARMLRSPRIDGKARRPRGPIVSPGSDCALFLSQSMKSLPVTASIFPSSRFLAAALLRQIDFSSAFVIVELGIGTGAITRQILRRLGPRTILYGVDLNPHFVSHVRHRIRDSRFFPILGCAESLGTLLRERGVRRADAIVSSLGLTSMAPEQRSKILRQVAEHLGPDGMLTQYQYVRPGCNLLSSLGFSPFAEEEFLGRYFREVSSERVLWNVPPATVYTCRL
jgi:phosphatidylethanolamine/phosphatidyl-N-methylethanolamine N-methyltransferase